MDSRTRNAHNVAESFITRFDRLDESTFCGYVYWRDSPYFQFVVEILLDGQPVGLVRAEMYSDEIRQLGLGDGYHGFIFSAQRRQLVGHRQIEARIANLGVSVGTPIDLSLQAYAPKPASRSGAVEWLGGLRLAGSLGRDIDADADPAPFVKVYEDGIVIAEAPARRWVSARHSSDRLDAFRFDLHLPAHYADGVAHMFRVTDHEERELDGSPVSIQAFDDGLVQHLKHGDKPLVAEEARAAWFDRFLPMSIPFGDYDDWKRRFPARRCILKQEPAVRVVLIGDHDLDHVLERLAKQTYQNWSAVALASPDRLAFDWRALARALEADVSGEQFAIFLNATTELRDDAIAQLSKALFETEAAVVAYSDIEVDAGKGNTKPVFFGAFDYERMLEQGHAAHFFAMRIDEIQIPTEEGTGTLARLFLTACDREGAVSGERIVHVPGALAKIVQPPLKPSQAAIARAAADHLRKRRVPVEIDKATGNLFPAIHVQRRHKETDLVSIIIPTRDRTDLLAPCIDSIRSRTRQTKYEIIVVDNGSANEETLRYLRARQRAGDEVVRVPGPFNHSYLSNAGVNAARGKLICLLNNDTEIIDSHWLQELASRIADPTTGAVSPKLVWPNGIVQHGGTVLGPNFAASDAFNDCTNADPGYGDLLRVAHESSAVSAACMLVRREDYLAISGFDEQAFPVLFNDVDFCLRMRAYGKRIILTPHVSVLHHESATRQRDQTPAQKGRFRRELALLRNRWGAVLANDPLYSPLLNLDPYPFSALAWPPRRDTPRLNVPPQPAVS